MKLSFKYKPKFTKKQLDIIGELSFHTTKLYNTANYECIEKTYKSYVDLEKELKSNWHREFLHSHTYQWCLKMLEQNWKSYFKAINDYKNNPKKYLGMPKPPRYKNTDHRKNEIIFTNLAIRVKGKQILLSLSKSMKTLFQVDSLNFNLPNKVRSLVNMDSLQQVRIKWDNSIKEWYLIIISNFEVKEQTTDTNIMSIDLGLDNLATMSFKDHRESYIINGKPLKSVNSYINKEIARLQGIRMKQVGCTKFKDTLRITKLRKYRYNYVTDYVHKASSKIIEIAKNKGVGTIVIGDIKNIKQESYIKGFVQVPIQEMVKKIEYKAKLEGIKVIKINEAYTSGCSALDLEKINKNNYNKTRRKARGMFETNTGIKINADVNGSLNILRKHLKDKCIPKLIKLARDKGEVTSPVRIRVA